jgi:hypothetical protein
VLRKRKNGGNGQRAGVLGASGGGDSDAKGAGLVLSFSCGLGEYGWDDLGDLGAEGAIGVGG